MSAENVEIIRRSQEHFMRTGDFAWDLMDPAIEVHDHDLPDVGVYRGRSGSREWSAGRISIRHPPRSARVQLRLGFRPLNARLAPCLANRGQVIVGRLLQGPLGGA